MDGRAENPFSEAKALRSRTWSPIATAGLFSACEYFEVIIPKGMFEREKWLSEGNESHYEVSDADVLGRNEDFVDAKP
jgi:hypothetical protein